MTNVTKAHLITAIGLKTKMRKETVQAVLDAALGEITASTAAGVKVQIKGFGTFETKHTAARPGRNPATGAPLEIPARSRLTFKASKPKA